MKIKITFLLLLLPLFLFSNCSTTKSLTPPVDTIKSKTLTGLKFRNLTPAFVSGRIIDFAVNPHNHTEYYVATAGGGIWKTTNNGTTFQPVFDHYGAYSIGCLTIDPKNTNVIWAGTGENNHQRSVSYGDGVYKSTDGGKSWKNMGLKDSRQIGMIAIDPRNSDVVYVAAEGSVWGPGGDRGLYKTTDGGKTWKKILNISENTGVNSIFIHPKDPDVLFATSEQRRRHANIRIGGGPESAIHKSTDGGKTWRKLTSGIPSVDKGGIGLAISPVNSDVMYAIIEAAQGKGGFFRSTDRGESWKKMSSYNTSGQYYAEITCDPKNVDKVFSTETRSKYTLDGGKTWKNVGLNKRHVDDHAIWIDPENTTHFMLGCDGGIYETFDDGANYIHKTNLPVTQFYRVNVDNAFPFYWIYGGTQDNSSLGAPSNSMYSDGISRAEWVVTLGGDGFWQATDPEDPNIVYSEYQYGNLYRMDKKSGEIINIKPKERKGEKTYKWNWNAPMIISPHSHTRLYMGAEKIFRSDDRGQSWKVISEDITRQIDRNKWPVMGRYWGIDAVAKDVSTSLYGMAVTMTESPVKENLLYVGTDDGLIQVTEDAGNNWRKIAHFPGVPEYTYVSDILCSKFDENTVFASFDNKKRDDFKPYLLKSTDKGHTWVSIAGNLPENAPVYTIEQDFKNKNLLFAGTEHGVYFTVDGGRIWTQLKSGIPTTAVRDMVIQKRESDLVLATFGRGFYILDDYSPLREINADFIKNKEAAIFPIKDAKMFIPRERGGYGFGSMEYFSKNAPFGATFTYFLKEKPKTLAEIRREKEKKLIKEKQPIPYPTMEEMRAEKNEIKPYLIFEITDEDGNPVRKLTAPSADGIHRITWNLRYSRTTVARTKGGKFNPLQKGNDGLLALPGKYYVTMYQYVRGKITKLTAPVPFNAVPLHNTTLPAKDRREVVAFQKKMAKLMKAVNASEQFARELVKRVTAIKQAALLTEAPTPAVMADIEKVEKKLDDILWKFTGQRPKASPEENYPAIPSINNRLYSITYVQWRSTSAVTQTQKDVINILEEEFPPVLTELKNIYNTDIPRLEKALDTLDAPWTPGRIPDYK